MCLFFAFLILMLAVSVVAAPHWRNGTAIPITKYSRLMNPDESLNFGALEAHVTSIKAKILRGAENKNNHQRNNGIEDPLVVENIEKRGRIFLYRAKTFGWFGEIAVGTPSKTFTVMFDTGSSDMFLPTVWCDSSCNEHKLWDPDKSSTSEIQEKKCELVYEDGSEVAGELYTDDVSLSGLLAMDQTFCGALTYSEGYKYPDFYADGLMGLGFQSTSKYDASPVFQTLIIQGEVVDQKFSFMLSDEAEMYVGGSNAALYDGDFTFVPVLQSGQSNTCYWKITLESIQANNEVILSNMRGIVDTGSSVVVGPTLQVAKLHEALDAEPYLVNSVPVNGYYTFPCDRMPTIGLSFGGKLFPIAPSALMLAKLPSPQTQCLSGIVGRDIIVDEDDDGGVWIIGNVFLRDVYTTFDVGDLQVGFANLK